MRRRLLIAAVPVLLAALAAGIYLLLFNGASSHPIIEKNGQKEAKAQLSDPKAASWNKPWHAGNPQASSFGQAYQVLDQSHPAKNSAAVYWLGPRIGNLYPYVRAMLGHGAEVMLSTVIYGDKRSADLAHLELSSYDTRPLPPDSDSAHPDRPQVSEGGKLEALLKAGPQQTDNGYHWTTPAGTLHNWQAIVQIGPHTVLEIMRLDGTAPPLAKIFANLRPYPN